MIRWEVWVGDIVRSQLTGLEIVKWRFNACFSLKPTADAEELWYRSRGYDFVEVRARTTRYQQRRHVTTGGQL